MVNSDVSPLMNDSRRIIASANKQGSSFVGNDAVKRRVFPLRAFPAIGEKKLTILEDSSRRGRGGSGDNEGVVIQVRTNREDTEFFLIRCRFYHGCLNQLVFCRRIKILVQVFLELLYIRSLKGEDSCIKEGKEGERKF